MKLVANNYGKGRVRVAKVIRDGEWHVYKNYTVQITLEGDVSAAYVAGDNALVLPTDTMKNSTYAIAATHDFSSPEQFGLDLSARFLATAPHLTSAQIEIEEQMWKRMVFDGEVHNHAFMGNSSERRTASIKRTHEGVSIESGIKEMYILKTTGSAFVGFFRDEYTILPEETDRIMATNLTATWCLKDAGDSAVYNQVWEQVRSVLLETFANHDSESVQHTLYEMGQAVFTAVPQVAEIGMEMPNVHNIPYNFSLIGIDSKNEVFVPIDEPYGMISGRLRADDAE